MPASNEFFVQPRRSSAFGCRRRMVRELLEQVLGIPLSLGSIQNSWEEASDAVAEPCAELERQLPHEPVVNSDETGYRTSGEKRWLWALVAANFVFYKIAASSPWRNPVFLRDGRETAAGRDGVTVGRDAER